MGESFADITGERMNKSEQMQLANTALLTAGENLLLCRRYHPVAEIIDLLEELEAPDAAQKLRGAMVRTGSIKPEEVVPYSSKCKDTITFAKGN